MDILQELRKVIEKAKLDQGSYSIWNLGQTLSSDLKDLPIEVGKNVWKGVLLPEETHLYLGSFNKPTVLSIICQNSSEGIHHGRITLIGPDLHKIITTENLFGLLILIGGQKITKDITAKIRSTIYISNQIEGIELSSNLKQKQFKIGKEIFYRGISFKHIGEAIFKLYLDVHKNLIESIEIIIITQGESLINELLELNKHVQHDYYESIKDKLIKYVKMRDDCDFDWDCKICNYQAVCEEIRKIIIERSDKFKNKE